MNRKEQVLLGSVAIFICTLILTSITASKLWAVEIPIISYEIIIPVGTSLFALTFLCTDSIAEIWGPRYAYVTVFLGFICRVLSLAFIMFAIDVTPVTWWENQVEYDAILGSSKLIIVAGIIAYLASQLNDVFVFHRIRMSDGDAKLWKRNIVSTFTSQTIDSFLFIVIAFGSIFSVTQIVSAIIGQVLVKWIIALLDTPFVYMIRNYAYKRKLFDFS